MNTRDSGFGFARRVGTDADGWPVYGRLVAGEIETIDDIALSNWQLVHSNTGIRSGPRQVGVDPDGFPIWG